MNFKIPSELDMLVAFSIEPIESNPKDGYWCYEFQDDSGTTLKLAFNYIERYIHTSIHMNGEENFSTTQEGATRLLLTKTKPDNIYEFFGDCEFKGAKSTLRIQIKPFIKVTWSTLEVYD